MALSTRKVTKFALWAREVSIGSEVILRIVKFCLQASQDMTYGHKMELFVLDLSFFGWYLVGSLCLGVGALWVRPYHETTRALFYEQLKRQ